MGRVLHGVAYGGKAADFLFEGSSGFILMLAMIAISVSIMSLMIFVCADGASGKPRRRRGGGARTGAAAGHGGGGGGGGDGGGCGSGGGCGGGGGGDFSGGGGGGGL